MSFNLYLKVTKHGNLQQCKWSFWRCLPQNDRRRYLFSATGLGWNIRGASQENGGEGVAGALGKQRAQEVNSSTEPGATANVTERYQPADYLPERG